MPERPVGGECAAVSSCVSSSCSSLPVSFGEDVCFPVGVKGAGDVLDGAARLSGFENDGRVGVVGFDFSGLDSLEDLAREALGEGNGALGGLVEELARERVLEAECAVVVRLVGLLLGKEKKALAVYGLADACGLLNLVGLSQTKVAKRLGVSKQDVQNMSEEFSERLGLRQTRTHRGRVSRERMRLGNFRPKAGVGVVGGGKGGNCE